MWGTDETDKKFSKGRRLSDARVRFGPSTGRPCTNNTTLTSVRAIAVAEVTYAGGREDPAIAMQSNNKGLAEENPFRECVAEIDARSATGEFNLGVTFCIKNNSELGAWILLTGQQVGA
jgi:hypothetical protein